MNFKTFIRCTEMHPSYEYKTGMIEDGFNQSYFKGKQYLRAVKKVKRENSVVGYVYKEYHPDCSKKVALFSVASIALFRTFYQFSHEGTKLKFLNNDSHSFEDKFFEEDFFFFRESLEENGEFDNFIFLSAGLREDSSIDEYECEIKAPKPLLTCALAIRYDGIIMIEESYDVNLDYTRIKMNDGTTIKCLESVDEVYHLIQEKISIKNSEKKKKRE